MQILVNFLDIDILKSIELEIAEKTLEIFNVIINIIEKY